MDVVPVVSSFLPQNQYSATAKAVQLGCKKPHTYSPLLILKIVKTNTRLVLPLILSMNCRGTATTEEEAGT